ncbi:MAG: response regulator transcription factor [Sphingopyxis sp.]
MRLVEYHLFDRQPKIGVCTSDILIFSHIKDALGAAGMGVVHISSPAFGADGWRCPRFDALVFAPYSIRIDLKDKSILDRRAVCECPILALTLEDCATQRTAALINGADDAVYCLGDGREIAARLRSLMRRYSATQNALLACDELEIDLIDRRVARGGRPIAMPLREFDLLSHLARSRDQAVPRIDLLRAVWRIDFDPGTNRIDVHMSRLRQRIDHGHPHAMLRTIKGIGYALVSRSGERNMLTQIQMA